MNERCKQLARTKFIDNSGKNDIEHMMGVVDEYYYEFLKEKIRWFFDYDYQKQLCDKLGFEICKNTNRRKRMPVNRIG